VPKDSDRPRAWRGDGTISVVSFYSGAKILFRRVSHNGSPDEYIPGKLKLSESIV